MHTVEIRGSLRFYARNALSESAELANRSEICCGCATARRIFHEVASMDCWVDNVPSFVLASLSTG